MVLAHERVLELARDVERREEIFARLDRHDRMF